MSDITAVFQVIDKIWGEVREDSGSNGLHPTLSKGAKDGAPECLGLIEGEQATAEATAV